MMKSYSGGRSPSDHQHSAKRRCLLSVESRIYHHPLFDEVDATAENEGMVTIHVLSDEILDMILSYFNMFQILKLSSVCQRWYNLCLLKVSRIESFSSPVLFKHIIRHIPPIKAVMSFLSVNCGSLTTLSLNNFDGLNGATFSHICDFLPNLVNLKLETSKVLLKDETILAVLREKLAWKLEQIALIGTYTLQKKVLRNVLTNCKRLTHLTLENWNDSCDPDESDGSILPMVLCPSNPITSVELGCFEPHTDVLEYIMTNYAATLRYLSLSANNPASFVSTSTIRSIPRMNNMEIFFAYCYDDCFPDNYSTRLISVIELMPNLRVLDLSGHHHFANKSIDITGILSRQCPLLEELHLSNCWIPTEKLEGLKDLKYLKRLSLRYLRKYGINDGFLDYALIESYDTSLTFSFFASQVLPHMKELEYLEFLIDEYQVDDLILLLSNAGPKFKALEISIPNRREHKGRHVNDLDEIPRNEFEDVLPKCNVISRVGPLRIFIGGLYRLHKNSCKARSVEKSIRYLRCSCDDLYSFYNKMCPEYLLILSSSSEYDTEVYSNPRNRKDIKFVSSCGYLSDTRRLCMNLPIVRDETL